MNDNCKNALNDVTDKVDVPIDVGMRSISMSDGMRVEVDDNCTNALNDVTDEVGVPIDAGLWSIPRSDRMRVEIVKSGPAVVQQKNGPFSINAEGRSITLSWFHRKLENGESIHRTWRVYIHRVYRHYYAFIVEYLAWKKPLLEKLLGLIFSSH
ncbi:hypothetical protein A3Q56_08629 [Intoshia linei]|uniref:Uncharacterized protein n=1 Tax=Intoshia linei TaxID=1819745 RepID=A0A177ANR1_9BILA|nr:hypothetical protein A3Q56_08629 [Intoshia linei]